MPYIINPKYSHLKVLIENIDDYFQESEKVLYDKRNIIRLVSFEGIDYVVKSFKAPNLINKLVYRYFRPSKAKRSYEYSLKIGSQLTPEPIAYIEDTTKLALGKSYYISSYFQYDYTIHDVLKDKALSNRTQILKEFSAFTYQLHEKGILHHDYSHGNILIKNSSSPAQYEFKIIDINRMEFKSLNMAERLANFARIRADDNDMRIIIGRYTELMGLQFEVSFNDAILYRDEFYRRRKMRNKLRGK